MKHKLLIGIPLACATAAMAQNSAVVTQSGGSGNSAVVVQSGSAGHISIEQRSPVDSDSTKAINRVSLRAPQGTQTTINQQSTGANSVELNKEVQTTTAINQSSDINDNSVRILPDPPAAAPRSSKRRSRRP